MSSITGGRGPSRSRPGPTIDAGSRVRRAAFIDAELTEEQERRHPRAGPRVGRDVRSSSSARGSRRSLDRRSGKVRGSGGARPAKECRAVSKARVIQWALLTIDERAGVAPSRVIEQLGRLVGAAGPEGAGLGARPAKDDVRRGPTCTPITGREGRGDELSRLVMQPPVRRREQAGSATAAMEVFLVVNGIGNRARRRRSRSGLSPRGSRSGHDRRREAFTDLAPAARRRPGLGLIPTVSMGGEGWPAQAGPQATTSAVGSSSGSMA